MPSCWRCEECFLFPLSEHECRLDPLWCYDDQRYYDEIYDQGTGAGTEYEVRQEENRTVSDQNYPHQETIPLQLSDPNVSELSSSPSRKRLRLSPELRAPTERRFETFEAGDLSRTATPGRAGTPPRAKQSVKSRIKISDT